MTPVSTPIRRAADAADALASPITTAAIPPAVAVVSQASRITIHVMRLVMDAATLASLIMIPAMWRATDAAPVLPITTQAMQQATAAAIAENGRLRKARVCDLRLSPLAKGASAHSVRRIQA